MHWYEWVFSGIGASVLVGVVGYFFSRFHGARAGVALPLADQSQNTSIAAPISESQVAVGDNITQNLEIHHHHSNRNGEWTSSKPSPRDIAKNINSAVPFDRDQVQQKYRGLDVRWEMRMGEIGKGFPKGQSIVMLHPKDGGPIVSFMVGIVPKVLQVAHEGALLRVSGRIRSVGSGSIYLEDDPEILIAE